MKILIGMIVLLLSAVQLSAADVTLAWDAPTDGMTTGYVIAYGFAPGSYGQQQDVGFVTQAAVSGLAAGTHYFVVRAYDAEGDLSDPSNEVSATIAAPTITSVSLSSNVPSPQQVGLFVTWTAGAAGGVSPYQFQFWSQKTGSGWVLGRDWSTLNTWSWSPTIGDYLVRVDARSAGGVASELSQSAPFSIVKKCNGHNCR